MLFPSLRGYRPEWLRGDVIGGLTVSAVLVPESLAYASIAGGCRRSSASSRAAGAGAVRAARQPAGVPDDRSAVSRAR
ncbi:MAG TPA: SulP family inorganic anion transporter [Solirubrobacteraceae bacterium]